MTKTEHWELREDSPLWLIAYTGLAIAAFAGMGYLFIAWRASGDASPFEHGRPLIAAVIMIAIILPSMALTQILGWLSENKRRNRRDPRTDTHESA